MRLEQTRYSEFGIVRDMLAAVDVIRAFEPAAVEPIVPAVRDAGRLFLTGEGSSRIFPAKNAIADSRRRGDSLAIDTEAGSQAAEYDLADHAVLGVSNSGRTAEVIGLFSKLKEANHQRRFSLAAHADSKLESLATRGFTLSCGPESAVAATKSVLEQALFARALVDAVAGRTLKAAELSRAADQVQAALTAVIDPAITAAISQAKTIYWAGRNDGVAEELTLKTNEITRKSADFLEGTYAVHGVEEVMSAEDVLIWVDPYPESEAKFQEVLATNVGVRVFAISSRPTLFPTIAIEDAGPLAGFVQMAAGWNVLVEVGLALGIDLDKPLRARKVGNEFTEPGPR
ncbi:MAG: SIS domain-containing protein [Planctomyces sp.]|nr:SIS domain-containing protein [Planctomyces sp.]